MRVANTSGQLRSPSALGIAVRSTSEAKQSRSPGDAADAASACTLTPCAAERIERQVNAIERPEVLGAILQMVDHLQRRAQRIR